jgi:hypothetical protein
MSDTPTVVVRRIAADFMKANMPKAIASVDSSPPKPARTAARRAGASTTPEFTVKDSQSEADRLIDEGCHIRYASVRRRMALQGPLNFIDPPKHVPNVTRFDELIPTYLKKVPPSWQVTADGFVCLVNRSDAAVISQLVNARKDELGVYSCVRAKDGYRVVFEF